MEARAAMPGMTERTTSAEWEEDVGE
jgi:hypothetical protein